MANFDNTSELAWNLFLRKLPEYPGITERDAAALYAQCIETQVLKAPATAQFPPLSDMIVNGSSGNYSVSGYVDSQNSYGAVIRTQYTYNVVMDQTGRWTCPNKFVSTQSQINSQMMGNTILWWILGILGTIITFAITSCQINSMF